MCEFRLSTFVLMICVCAHIDRAFSEDLHDALVILSNVSTSRGINLPFKAEESEDGQVIYPETTPVAYGSNVEYSFLCRPQTQTTMRNKLESLRKYPEAEYCLVKTYDIELEGKCKNEAKPLFTIQKHKDAPTTQCGKSFDHLLYGFGYNYCIFDNDPERVVPLTSQLLFSLYDVCYDTVHSETLWTRHEVRTGLMLHPPGLPSQKIPTPRLEDLSIDPNFLSNKKTFLKIAEKYQQQKPNTYKMVPQMLVPHEDMALKIWKKPTIHLVNTGPLWENLVPLMNAINNGIRNAAIEVSWTTYNPNKSKSETLDIYTITYSHLSWFEQWINRIPVISSQQFGLNIWCKFVYNESTSEGVMIYLHNLPDNPPVKTDPEPNEYSKVKLLKEKECDDPVPCNFKIWSDNPDEVSDELMSYAYCCRVDHDKIKEFFNLTLNYEIKLLKIDNFFRDRSNSNN